MRISVEWFPPIDACGGRLAMHNFPRLPKEAIRVATADG
jgi:hypothetical protein